MIAVWFLWGYARIKTLAGLARTLKSLVAEAKQNTRSQCRSPVVCWNLLFASNSTEHQENNRVLEEENEKIVQSLADFKNSVGLVDR